MGVQQVPTDELELSPGVQSRVQMDMLTVCEYAEDMRGGAQFPPIEVVWDGSVYWVWDGFHRTLAAKQAGIKELSAKATAGNLELARWLAAGANRDHGIRRTNADKRRAVEQALGTEEGQRRSDNQIAQHCGVSQPFVSKVRQELSYNDYKTEGRVVTRNGTTYQMNTANIGNGKVAGDGPTASLWDILDEGDTCCQNCIHAITVDNLEHELVCTIHGHAIRHDALLNDYRPERAARCEHFSDEEPQTYDAHVMQVMSSSESPEWYTPRHIVDLTLELFGGVIDTDPCSNSKDDPNVPATLLYTKEDDGLAQTWHGAVYMNPPYGKDIPCWVEAMVDKYEHGEIREGIALLPGRIDTRWFQPLYDYLICHIRGRLNYPQSECATPFPSVIVYLGGNQRGFIETFSRLGPILKRVDNEHF